jgi:hypothetical protein
MRARRVAAPTAILFFGCSFASGAARANDSQAELALGGLTLTKSDAISMESEDLYISRDLVRVKYRFINKTDAPIDTLVAFPLPDIASGSPNAYTASPGPVVSMLKFKTTVDGQPLALQVVEQAFLKEQDVSARLSALRIPLNRYAPDFVEAIERLPKADRDRLVADGFISDEGVHDEEGIPDQPMWASQWTLRTTVTRRQTFPAHKTVTVEHEYTPTAGGSVGSGLRGGSSADFTKKRHKYCIENDWLASFDKKLKELQKTTEESPHSVVWIGYVLKTGANWRGPIGDFHLVVDKTKPDSLVSFCAAGVKKLSPTRFEVRYSNFTPKDDLDILIVDWER